MRFSCCAAMFLTLLLGALFLVGGVAQGQAAPAGGLVAPKLESCKPVSERTGAEGCWILVSAPVGVFTDRPVYWTLDRYPTRERAQSAAAKNSTVVEALGQVWLFRVGDRFSAPVVGATSGATRVAEIGPIPVKAGEEYTAQYRESIMQPGSVSRTHLHSGPEVFYTESGETCLETPSGKQVGRKGADIIAPEGEPMELMATGSDMRRGVVLVLHASSKPHTTLVTEWVSKGLCKAGR
jgi:quercetin dioxygenase-like cupin family protein